MLKDLDKKYFHIIDTETREIEKIHNPHNLFEKVLYNDEEIDYNNYDVSKFDSKFVKVVVVNKNDGFTFDRFIDRIQNQSIHELKISENLMSLWVRMLMIKIYELKIQQN